MVAAYHWIERQKNEDARRRCGYSDNDSTHDGLRTMGAPGAQLASTGVRRLERRPVEPAPGFDPNLPVIYIYIYIYIGVPWVHGLRHGVTMHPTGATFEGRQDPMVPWNEPQFGR